MSTDSSEAAAWNGVMGGGSAAPAPCADKGKLTDNQAMALVVGATMAGFFTGVLAKK